MTGPTFRAGVPRELTGTTNVRRHWPAWGIVDHSGWIVVRLVEFRFVRCATSGAVVNASYLFSEWKYERRADDRCW
jgi:hypothetical protein